MPMASMSSCSPLSLEPSGFHGRYLWARVARGNLFVLQRLVLGPGDRTYVRQRLASHSPRCRYGTDRSVASTGRLVCTNRTSEELGEDVKDYKVIALDPQHNEVTKLLFLTDGINRLPDLHGRKLIFKTDFRPRARYVWWTFLAAVLKTGWQQKTSTETKAVVHKANRYWDTKGRYVKKNILGFVEELGQDVDSILENALEENEVETALQEMAMVRSQHE